MPGHVRVIGSARPEADAAEVGRQCDNRPVVDRVLCPRLVGRDEQLFVLEDALLAAHGGESRFVAVGGEAGIGKTRLASELAKRARRLGWAVL